MQITDFDFELPVELIAQQPLRERTASRLLCLDRNSDAITHQHFTDLEQLLNPHDLLVFNDTKVIPARLRGQKQSGGKIELLVERVLSANSLLAQIKASKAPKPGTKLILEPTLEMTVIGRKGDLYELQVAGEQPILQLLQQHGAIPLPPYITREPTSADHERYQTVYAKAAGAVAAPTAGLHFDAELLQRLAAQGVESAYLTLHVGAGTFQPVREREISEHKMHAEWFEISAAVVAKVKAAKERGGRVVAVGTTSVRSLETAARSGELQPYSGETSIFIYPGFNFNCVDALITNFHLPRSTLLLLVSAFAGRERVLKAYAEAVRERYRFFSYGDAMFIK